MRKLYWFLSVAVFVEASSLATAQTTWETVTSKEGQFTVEMPKQPDIKRTRTRRGAGGVVRVSTVGCKTESGVYLVYRIDLPTAVVRGAEEGELDGVRDDLAKSGMER